MLVVREQLDKQLSKLGELGFPAFRTLYEVAPGDPFVLGSGQDGLKAEVCIFERSIGGRLSCRLWAADGMPYRITLASDAIDSTARTLDGMPIRTVSPLGLYQIRAASQQIGAFGSPRPHDAVAQQQLKQRFLSDRNESDLLPDIERLAG